MDIRFLGKNEAADLSRNRVDLRCSGGISQVGVVGPRRVCRTPDKARIGIRCVTDASRPDNIASGRARRGALIATTNTSPPGPTRCYIPTSRPAHICIVLISYYVRDCGDNSSGSLGIWAFGVYIGDRQRHKNVPLGV
jgi:hypothetical protein